MLGWTLKGVYCMYRICFFVLCICIISVYCGKDKSTNPSFDNNSYTPLNKGDITQVISLSDSSTNLLEIGEKIER